MTRGGPEVVLRARVEGFLQRRTRVDEGGVGDAVAHVDEVDGAHLLRRRGAGEARKTERQRPDEADPQQHREHPLRDRQVGEAPAHDPEQVRRDQHEPEHARREQLVVPLAAVEVREREGRSRVPDVVQVEVPEHDARGGEEGPPARR